MFRAGGSIQLRAGANGIYFIPALGTRNRNSIRYYDLRTKKTSEVFRPDKTPGIGLSISPGETWLCTLKFDQEGSGVMLIDLSDKLLFVNVAVVSIRSSFWTQRGTVRREHLDRTLLWTTVDLETKLLDFQHYCNGQRTHAGLDGRVPE